jgi:hypothetical protein
MLYIAEILSLCLNFFDGLFLDAAISYYHVETTIWQVNSKLKTLMQAVLV